MVVAHVLDASVTSRSFAFLLAAVAAYKSLEYLAVFGPLLWTATGALLLLGAGLTIRRPDLGPLLIAAGALLANMTPAYRNHVALLFWLALTSGVFPDERQQRWLLRCTLTIMYAFAAAAKLWPTWLSGEALLARTWLAPHLPRSAVVGLAALTVLVEAALAIGVWRHWRGWFVLAVAMHVSFVAFTQTDPWDLGRLAVFGTLSIATWMWASPSYASFRDSDETIAHSPA
jgi:hypothetical protein